MRKLRGTVLLSRLELFLAGGLLLAGCAGTDVQTATASGGPGIYYADPEPYLAVTLISPPGSPPVYGSQILWLPNYGPGHVHMVITKTGWLQSTNTSVTLADGWRLVSFGSQTSSQLPQTISALAGLLIEAAPLMAVGPGHAESRSPVGLYRIRFDAKTGIVAGFNAPISGPSIQP